MTKKYNSLKNMTEEEKKAYKRAQKNAIQREWYKNNKEKIKEKYKGKYHYAAIYKARIDKAIEYIEIFKNDIRGIDEIVLLEILKGEDHE